MIESSEKILIRCDDRQSYDEVSNKLHELGYIWGVSGRFLIDKCLYPLNDMGFVFEVDIKKKKVHSHSRNENLLNQLSPNNAIKLIEENHNNSDFKELNIQTSGCENIFKKGNLVTSKEKPFELIILVISSEGRHANQFTGVIIRFPKSFPKTTQIGDMHYTFQYKDFELITDMELCLKVKLDEQY